MMPMTRLLIMLLAITCPLTAVAADSGEIMDFTRHWAGFIALAIFFLAYSLVIAEEYLHLRKSKPVIVAAGIIWALVALVYAQHGDTHTAEQAVRHNLLELAQPARVRRAVPVPAGRHDLHRGTKVVSSTC